MHAKSFQTPKGSRKFIKLLRFKINKVAKKEDSGSAATGSSSNTQSEKKDDNDDESERCLSDLSDNG